MSGYMLGIQLKESNKFLVVYLNSFLPLFDLFHILINHTEIREVNDKQVIILLHIR